MNGISGWFSTNNNCSPTIRDSKSIFNLIEERTMLISIIVPVYNTEKYLDRCIQSICKQSYQEMEILLVDDGSTDRSLEICKQWAEKDGRIQVFTKENGGSSSARNLGITKAQGEYLGFVDSDDYIEDTMYEDLVHAVVDYKALIAQVGRDEVAEDGTKLPNVCEPPNQVVEEPAKYFMEQLLLHKGDCSFCTKLVHRSLFQELCFPLGVLNEDFHVLVQMLPQISHIVSLPKQAYHVYYRMGSNTRQNHGFSRVYIDNIHNAKMVLEIVRKEFSDLETIAFRFGLFQRLDYLLHIPVRDMTKDNEEYKRVISYLRQHRFAMLGNPYLDKKSKLYLFMLSLAPRNIRQLHRKMKGWND